MQIDTNCVVMHNRFGDEIDMWRELGYLPDPGK